MMGFILFIAFLVTISPIARAADFGWSRISREYKKLPPWLSASRTREPVDPKDSASSDAPYIALLKECTGSFPQCFPILAPLIFRSNVIRSDFILRYINNPSERSLLKQNAKDPVALINTIYPNISQQSAKKLATTMLVDAVEAIKDKPSFEDARQSFEEEMTTDKNGQGAAAFSEVVDFLEKNAYPSAGDVAANNVAANNDLGMRGCMEGDAKGGGGATPIPNMPTSGDGDPSPIGVVDPDAVNPRFGDTPGVKPAIAPVDMTFGGVLKGDPCDGVDWNNLMKKNAASYGTTKHIDNYAGSGTVRVKESGETFHLFVQYTVVTYAPEEKGQKGTQTIEQTVLVSNTDGDVVDYQHYGPVQNKGWMIPTGSKTEITVRSDKIAAGKGFDIPLSMQKDVGATDISSGVPDNAADVSPLDDKVAGNAYLDCKSKSQKSAMNCAMAAINAIGGDQNGDDCNKQKLVKMVDPNAPPTDCHDKASAKGLDISKFFSTGTGLGVIDPSPSQTQQTNVMNPAQPMNTMKRTNASGRSP